VEPVREQQYHGSERQVHPRVIEKQKNSDFIFNIKYTWIHDYLNLFDCAEVIPMSHNRNMFIVNL
jgi:hypothetical protein